MSETWPKVIRDPLHNIIPFEDRPWDRLLLSLINAKEFQRLRRIKQLGVSNFVFPGADHTRFAHCIGVMHTAKMFLERLETVLGRPTPEEQRTAVLTAALLHDVGHGPFYFHKTTRAAEVMLRLLFKRLKELLDVAEGEDAKRMVAPGIPDAVLRAFSGAISLGDYLTLDDHTISEVWKCCEHSEDPLLKELGSGLLHRRLYKAIDVTGRPIDKVADFVSEARGAIEEHGLLPEYSLVSDTPEDTPYKPYDPDSEKPANQIYVQNAAGKIEALTANSDIVQPLTKKYTLTRYYCPEGLRDELKALAEAKLGKD